MAPISEESPERVFSARSDDVAKIRENFLRVIFKPITENLERIREATPEELESRQEPFGGLGKDLLILGRFIESRQQDGFDAQFINDFWTYVATFWPLDPSSGAEMQEMYNKLRKAELAYSQEYSTTENSTTPDDSTTEDFGMEDSRPKDSALEDIAEDDS